MKCLALRGVNAENRGRACPVRLPSLLLGDTPQHLVLSFQLLLAPTDGYIGIVLFDNGTEVYRFLFETTLPKHDGRRIKAACNLFRGFPSHDGKCCLMITGQASANSVMPCLRCIEEKKHFARYQDWMHNHRPASIPKSTSRDAAIRNDEFSNVECYEKFALISGGGMYTPNKAVNVSHKRAACSVVCEPCVEVNALKETGGPMHISSGIIDHLISDTRKILRKIDSGGPLIQQLKAFEASLEHFILAPLNDTIKDSKLHDIRLSKWIETAEKQLKAANNSRNKPAIATAKEHLEICRKTRFLHAKTSGLGSANLTKKGASEVLAAVKSFLADCASSKNVCGEGEFVFNKAIEMTGAWYRKEHGGMSLSNAHAIIVAEKHTLVAQAVEATYVNDPAKQALVMDAMRVFRLLAEPAYRIARILKSQGKIDDVTPLKDAICDFSVSFREEFEVNGRRVYAKLHWLECIHVPFIVENRFLGLGSEEGFEATHNRLKWLKTMLLAMPFTKDRGIKQGQRYQCSLLPEFEAVYRKLNPPIKKRQPYKKKTFAEKEKKNIQRLAGSQEDPEIGPDFVKLPSGNIIYRSWQELYMLCMFKMPTKQMHQYITSNQLQTNQKLANLVHYA